MWFLRASCRVTSQTSIFGVGCNIPNVQTLPNQIGGARTQAGGPQGRRQRSRDPAGRQPRGPALLEGLGTQWGQIEKGPTNHPVSGGQGQGYRHQRSALATHGEAKFKTLVPTEVKSQ